MLTDALLKLWQAAARRDDANNLFLPSDIRVMLGEIERCRAALRGVVRVADRNTVEFDAARECLAIADGRYGV